MRTSSAFVRTVTIRLGVEAAQDPREQLGSLRQRFDEHVLVERVGAAALGAEAVAHRDAERGDEVAVGAAGDGRLAELELEPAADLARAGEERRAGGRAL